MSTTGVMPAERSESRDPSEISDAAWVPDSCFAASGLTAPA
jgi:hypothetical protein